MKKRILILMLLIVMINGLVGCGSSNGNNEKLTNSENAEQIGDDGELLKKAIIGSWTVAAGTDNHSYTDSHAFNSMDLYEGGTGRGNSVHGDPKCFYDLKWEIVDGIVNLTYGNVRSVTVGFKYDDGKLGSVDGEVVFVKE